MAVSYVKFCPRCQTTTLVDSAVCAKCGHQFRTHFDPPVSEKTISMTVTVTSEEGAVTSLSRNGHHQIPANRAEAPWRPRLQSRRLLILLTAIIAAAVLYGGLHFSHGRDRVGQGGSPTRQATFSPYEVVVKGENHGQPTPLALHDPRDLLRWQMTANPAAPNSATATDNPVQVHLYLSGHIALIPAGTHARVLQEGDQWQRVAILDGPHQSLTGYVNHGEVERTPVSSSSPH